MFAGLLILASVAALQVHVEEGELSGPLRHALILELGRARVVDASADAELLCALVRTEGALVLILRSPDDVVLLERRIEVAGGDLDALVRVAVVLIARRAEGIAEPAAIEETPAIARDEAPRELPSIDEPAVPPDLPIIRAPRAFGATLRVVASTWQKPFTPRIGPELAVWLQRGDFGLAFSAALPACCVARNDVEVDAIELLLFLEANMLILRTGRLEANVFVAGGARWLTGDSRALIFEATGTTERVSLLAPGARAGSTLLIRVSDVLAVELAAGATFFFGGGKVDLPPPYRQPNTTAFDTGVIAPWLAAGVSYSVNSYFDIF